MTSYPLAGYQFRVSIDGVEMGFSRADGVQHEIETQTYQEGGLNDRVHVLIAPCKTEHILRLEKGAYQNVFCPFYLAGERLKSALRLEVLNDAGEIAKVYTLTNILVKKWEVGELNASQNSILIDKFELSYEMMEVSNL